MDQAVRRVSVGILALTLLASLGPARTAGRVPVFGAVRAEAVGEDGVLLSADVPGLAAVGATTPASAPEMPHLLACIGKRDAGHQPDAWDHRIIVAPHVAGRLEVPLEGLQPDTQYFYAFMAKTPAGEEWSETASFTTRPERRIAIDPRSIAGASEFGDAPERGFASLRPAARWEEGLLSGNGRMGALVMSRPLDERIILTHERLFLPWHDPLPPVDTANSLPLIRDLIRQGHYEDSADLVVTKSLEEGYGPKRWTDMFIPAFDLLVHMEGDSVGDVRRYLRSLDYSTGVATVQWTDSRGGFRRRLFVSRPDNVVILSISGPLLRRAGFDCALELATRPIDKENSDWREQEKFAQGIGAIDIAAEDGWLTYRSRFAKSQGGYQGAARVVARGGRAALEGRRLLIQGASEILVLLRLEVLERYDEARLARLKSDIAALPADFNTLLRRHSAVHGEMFNRVRLDLAGGSDRFLPSERLISKSTSARPSMALLEKIFDAGRYTVLSSSGEWPPNLQGVWTGTWGAPWSGDYTLTGNVQSAIASLLSANLPECMESVFNYVDMLMPGSRANARRLHGARGIAIASRASTHGFNNHFDKTWPMTFWTAGAGWLAHFYYDYYLYTGDLRFLRERALPFMKDAALFYEDFLVEDEHGKYAFIPSYSPENNPRNSPSQAAINATMDIAVAKELLTNLVAACETLNVDAEGVQRWKRMLAKLPDYHVSADGALKEWAWVTLEDNYEHRHCSHLYPLFYGVAPDLASHPELQAAARRAIELRMKERERQGGGVMAFGAIQLAEAAASLGDGETGFKLIGWLAARHYYTNFASSHDPGPAIFNVDIAGGLPDVMVRMLVQSAPGRLDLLPALPAAFPRGVIEGLPARGQVTIEMMHWAPGQIELVLRSKIEQSVHITSPGSPTPPGEPPEPRRTRDTLLPAGKQVKVTIGR